MPKPLTITDFSGGRNSKTTSPALEKNETRDQVYTWVENGALVKMRGWSAVAADTGGGINPVYPIQFALTPLGAAGINRLVIMGAIAAGGLTGAQLAYTDNGTTFAKVEATPTTFVGTAIPFMGMFGSYLYVSDGTNAAVRYDGTNVTTVTDFPKYNVCAVHKNYIFAASGTTLKWCLINDPTNWPANNFQTVTSEIGESIIALRSWGGNLLIFCRRSMWIFVGDVFDPIEANYYLQRVNTPSNFNFFAAESIGIHSNAIKFLTADGIYVYTGGNTASKISDNIQPDTDLIPSASSELTLFNSSNAARAYVWKNSYYLHYRASSVRKTIIQDERGKWWTSADSGNTPAVNTSPILGISANLGSGEKLYGGIPTKGMFLTLDTGYYLAPPGAIGTTVGVPAYWISKDFFFPSEVIMRYVDVYLKKQTAVGGLGTLTFSFSVDGATYIDKSVTMLTGTGEMLKKRIPISRIGRSIKFKVANSEAGVNFEIYQISMTYDVTIGTRS